MRTNGITFANGELLTQQGMILRETATKYKEDAPKISSSKEAERFFRPFFTNIDEVEEFHLITVTRANRIKGHYLISTGGVSGTVADMRVIMRYAINDLASGLFIAHNHPSGNMSASSSDITLTKKAKEAAALFDMQLLDHVILSPSEGIYTSLADEGEI